MLPGWQTRKSYNRAYLVYAAIADYWDEHGHAPGYSHLMKETGLPKSTLQYYLDKLRRLGYIDFDGKLQGTIRPVMRGQRASHA